MRCGSSRSITGRHVRLPNENLPFAVFRIEANILRKVAALFVTAALIALGLMFFLLILVAILTVGAMAWGYLWWKTRDLRKQFPNHSLGDEVIKGEVIEGEIIEGEVIRVIDSSNRGER